MFRSHVSINCNVFVSVVAYCVIILSIQVFCGTVFPWVDNGGVIAVVVATYQYGFVPFKCSFYFTFTCTCI